MKVYVKTYFDWIDGELKIVAEHSRLRFGPVAHCKGASSAQTQLQQQQAQFSQQLMGMYQQQFANQNAIFGAIQSVYNPILAAGPSQYGFSSAEDAALRTQASEGTAQAYRQAGSAEAQTMASAGGGNTLLPSGVQAQVQGQLTGAAAESEATKQLGITEAGYQQGRENFNNATNVEMGVAAGFNPLGYAGAATSANSSAANQATTIAQMNNAASPWGTIGGIIGGAAGAFLGNPALGGILGGGGSTIMDMTSAQGGGFLGNAGSMNTPTASPAVPGVFPGFPS